MAVKTDLPTRLPLTDYVAQISGARLNAAPRFVCFKTPHATAMLFGSGQMIVTGIPHPDNVSITVDTVLRYLSAAIRRDVRPASIRIKTILAKAALRRLVCPYVVVDLSKQQPHLFTAQWEPELCNAIIIHAHSCTMKVFPRTGSVISFGTSLASMNRIFTVFKSLLK